MSNVCSDVSMWLSVLSKHSGDTISLYTLEFKQLSKLGPVETVRVIKNPSGEPRLFFIDKLATIKLLKDLYAFYDKEDLSKELQEAKELYLES